MYGLNAEIKTFLIFLFLGSRSHLYSNIIVFMLVNKYGEMFGLKSKTWVAMVGSIVRLYFTMPRYFSVNNIFLPSNEIHETVLKVCGAGLALSFVHFFFKRIISSINFSISAPIALVKWFSYLLVQKMLSSSAMVGVFSSLMLSTALCKDFDLSSLWHSILNEILILWYFFLMIIVCPYTDKNMTECLLIQIYIWKYLFKQYMF